MTTTGNGADGAGDEPGRRLTPTERYHQLVMTIASRQPYSPEHALTLTRNAKGDVQIELAVRGAELDDLVTSATAAFDGLCTRYPRERGE